MDIEQNESITSSEEENSEELQKDVPNGYKYSLRINNAESIFDPTVLSKVLNVDEDISKNVKRSIVVDGKDFVLTYELQDPKRLRSILTNMNQQIA